MPKELRKSKLGIKTHAETEIERDIAITEGQREILQNPEATQEIT